MQPAFVYTGSLVIEGTALCAHFNWLMESMYTETSKETNHFNYFLPGK